MQCKRIEQVVFSLPDNDCKAQSHGKHRRVVFPYGLVFSEATKRKKEVRTNVLSVEIRLARCSRNLTFGFA